MATISNTPRPGYVWDSTDNVWYPIGTGPHTHADYITSGSAINPNIVDAKGDIIAATAADTVARLAVGSNDQVLTADSSTATGLKWATPGGALTVASIASGTVPSASSLSITGINADYLMLRLTDLKWGTANGAIIIRVNNDTNSNYSFLVVTTATGDTYQYYDASPSTLGTMWGTDTVANSRTQNNHRVIEIHNAKSSGWKSYTLRGYHHDGGGTSRGVMGGGWYKATAPITSIQIIQSDGYTFTSGSYELIGA
jgi:hypothetical protein